MIRALRAFAAMILLFAGSIAGASFHNFRIEQLYSNADGTIQFVVLHEAFNTNGESFWAGQRLTITDAQGSRFITFPSNLPSTATAGRRVLIATPGFAALGLVVPDFMMPSGFLTVSGGTLNYGGPVADPNVMYSSLPTDGVSAIDRNGTIIHNVATNFAGASASVAASAPVAFTPQIGVWWNPNESGTGYNFDIKHGKIVITIFTYEANTGHSEWYLSSGSMTDNNTKYTGPLDKYRNGQCISCPYVLPTNIGNDGTISVTFTSATSAVLSLPGNRTTSIQPLEF